MDYKKLNDDELKELCKKRGLVVAGKRYDLLKRLKADDNLTESKVEEKIDKSPSLFQTKQVANATYIQLNASNLSHYFNCGVVYQLALEESEIYRKENRKEDLLTLFPEHIIISSFTINELKDDDVLLDVDLSDLKYFSVGDSGISYISDPLPISRIKSVLFKNEKSRNTYVSSYQTFPDFFLDPSITALVPNSLEVRKIDLPSIQLPKNEKLAEWRRVLNKFDKVLGLFGYMKNTGIFFAERENSYQEISLNFIGALAIINPEIKFTQTKDLPLYKYILLPNETEVTSVQRFLFKQVILKIYSNIDFTIGIAKDIINEAIQVIFLLEEEKRELVQTLENINKLEINAIAFPDLLQMENIKRNYPVLALLFLTRFSNKGRQHTDKQAVRNYFIKNEYNLQRSVVEFLTAVLGLYYGYKNMIKEDTNLVIKDPVFERIATKQQSLKFRLNTSFERLTIESIFNFCKFGIPVPDSYDYFKSKTRQPPSIPSYSGSYSYKDSSFVISDTKITFVERSNRTAQLTELINKSYGERISPRSVLLSYLIASHGIDKKLLIQLMESNSDKIDLDQLQKLIEFDIKARNAR